MSGGALFPSHATLYLAPVGAAKACREKQQSFDGERQCRTWSVLPGGFVSRPRDIQKASIRHWEDFNGTMRKWYGTDFACMRDEFLEEQRKCPGGLCLLHPAGLMLNWLLSHVFRVDQGQLSFALQVLLADRYVCESLVAALA